MKKKKNLSTIADSDPYLWLIVFKQSEEDVFRQFEGKYLSTHSPICARVYSTTNKL